jgi:hypothetical protein
VFIVPVRAGQYWVLLVLVDAYVPSLDSFSCTASQHEPVFESLTKNPNSHSQPVVRCVKTTWLI